MDLSSTLTSWFNPEPSSMTQQQTQTMGAIGNMISIAGAIQGMVGTYYAAKSQKYQFESQRLSFEYGQDVAELNARMMERQAQSILLAGERQSAALTMRAGKIKSATKASQAARGLTLGYGSTAEEIATQDIMKETDALTINVNKTKAAWEARMRAAGFESQAGLLGVSAAGAEMMGEQISPFGAGLSSLIGSASTIASSWARDNKMLALAAQMRGIE